MNVFVADPDWGWWIIGYFFLGGIAAGAYFMATLIDLVGRRGQDEEISRIGFRIAFPLIVVCAVFLTRRSPPPTMKKRPRFTTNAGVTASRARTLIF